MDDPPRPDQPAGRFRRRQLAAWTALVVLAVVGVVIAAMAIGAQRRADPDVLGRLDQRVTRTLVTRPAAPPQDTATSTGTTDTSRTSDDDSHGSTDTTGATSGDDHGSDHHEPDDD